MGKIYTFLGLTVGCVVQGMRDDAKRRLTMRISHMGPTMNSVLTTSGITWPSTKSSLSRDLNFAIVDEVDSILIDEARTP